jgi:hypothetical protein
MCDAKTGEEDSQSLNFSHLSANCTLFGWTASQTGHRVQALASISALTGQGEVLSGAHNVHSSLSGQG